MKEIFKDVVGYEELFRVSNFGNLWSKRSNRLLRQFIHKNGYAVCSTRIGGRKGVAKCFKIHRLVAEAFLENPESKATVNHKDGNKLNNNLDNLEWYTPLEQVQHAIATGLVKSRKEENNPNAKITNDQAIQILAKREETGFGAIRLSKVLGYSIPTIRRVIENSSDSWKNLRDKFVAARSSVG